MKQVGVKGSGDGATLEEKNKGTDRCAVQGEKT